ncbi:hypothetical protein [Streptomyces halstedii]|uniref:hypothetical protein n=1 Tax=Streptomyces halstedii TaxID=1944 RepID=UPI0034616692
MSIDRRRPSNQHRPNVSRPGSTGLRFGMFAVCVTRDSDSDLNKGKAKPLYELLITFADVSSRDTSQGYPYRETLASCLDCSKQTIDRAADYLEKEIGLVKVHRRKVDGKPDENDANLYEIFDAWLIHGAAPPVGTPPQLVARYGHTVPGLDIDAWVSKHSPDFDLPAWRAAYKAKVGVQESKREEQRRKERARRKKARKGGDVTGDATPEGGQEVGGGVPHDASRGVMGDASRGVTDDALSRAGLPESSSIDGDAPSGRSPVDGRSPSTSGSREAGGKGGSAASGTTSPSPTPHDDTRRPAPAKKSSSKKAAHTREQLDQVRRVRALFPRELLDAEGGLPDLPTLSSAILTAMGEGRTVGQMGDRIWYRWVNHGFADIWAAEGRFEKPVGVAVALVRPLRRGDRFACPDLRCENGADIDTKVPCRLCAERIADWKAERARKRGQEAPRGANSVPLGAGSPDAALPPQRAAQPSAPLLRDCANDQCPTSVPTTGNPLCLTCQDDQAEAEQATRDMLAAWETEKAAAATERPPKEVDADALETARLRAELAAQYGTPDQQAAYCGSSAPF